MALRAAKFFMFSGQGEIGIELVIEIEVAPVIRAMTVSALIAVASEMQVIVNMAIETASTCLRSS